MENKHPINGIALGPGDPELLTIKALRLLKESDIIFFPGSLSKGERKSFVLPLLQYHGLEDKALIGFYLEMSADRQQAKQVYSETVQKIKNYHLQGKKVSVVCEGDLSLYASFSYILEELQALELPVKLVPGINAFSLGAAQHQVPLSLLNDKVGIIPRVKSIKEVENHFEQFDTLVLMKIRSVWKTLEQELLQKNWAYYYCERLGTNEEYITTNLKDITKRDIPYFSLLIIKKAV